MREGIAVVLDLQDRLVDSVRSERSRRLRRVHGRERGDLLGLVVDHDGAGARLTGESALDRGLVHESPVERHESLLDSGHGSLVRSLVQVEEALASLRAAAGHMANLGEREREGGRGRAH